MNRGFSLAVITAGVLASLQIVLAQQYRLDTLAQSPVVSFPTALAFKPDGTGSFFFTEKNSGKIKIFQNGSVRENAFATVSVTSIGEQGLLGIALHPQYPDSPFVYVQYTRNNDRANIVLRLRDSSGIGIQPRVIAACPRLNTATNNNGGACHFGPDGKLYISFGENATSTNAQDSSATNLRGKILRLNPDGSIPFDNPFPGKPFWSIGHRNASDFTWDPHTGIMYSSDGSPCGDEINRVARRANLGWPIEGNCKYTTNPAYLRPLYSFTGSLPLIAGVAVYRADAFPHLRGKLLVAGNANAAIWMMDLSEEGDTIAPGSFATFFSYGNGFTSLEVGPDGNIYLLSNQNNSSRLLRLRPVQAAFTTSAPLAATQDVAYSYKPAFSGTPPALSIVSGPDGMVLDTTTGAIFWTPSNTQALQGRHNVVLRAANGAGFVNQIFTITVHNVNDPPLPFSLSTPVMDSAFVFTNMNPSVECSWNPSRDPDLDSLHYVVQLDTVETFDSNGRLDSTAGLNVSMQFELPRVSHAYYWRVRATDGQDTLWSSEIFRFSITYLTTIVETKPRLKPQVQEAVLEQNFPNPFNPSTTITYTIPKTGFVRLSVFNLLGQEVAHVFSGVQTAGTYELQFDKEELPTGIYFYRIQAPGFAETRKMIITK